jgi:hypothetical protein
MPTKVTTIIQSILNNWNKQQNTIKEIENITCTVILQNYFKFSNDYYKREEGLAMGTQSSTIIAEIYLQFLEQNNIYDTLIKHKIIGYFRYADDILPNIQQKT